MTRCFKKHLGERVHLHVCKSYHSHTHQSSALTAERVANEMREAMQQKPCDRISVVCHSLGGIVMIWALHLLNRSNYLSGSVQLVNFVTIASPLLGIRGSFLGQNVMSVVKRLTPATREMCLEDTYCDTAAQPAAAAASDEPASTRDGPFLLRVARPDVLAVLGRFQRRAVYANAHGDLQVGYESAALEHGKPCTPWASSAEAPHISAASAEGGRDHAPSAPPAAAESAWLARDAKRAVILEMMRAYRTLPWERVDCLFGTAVAPSPFAHEQILGKVLGGLLEHRRGADVVEHVVRRFRVRDDEEESRGAAHAAAAAAARPPRASTASDERL